MPSRARTPLLFIGALALLALGPSPGSAQTNEGAAIPEPIVVETTDGTFEARTLAGPNGTLSALRANDPSVARVADRLAYQQFVSSTPNDPAYPVQWHLHRNQTTRSWQYGNGSGVTVAVVDSGVAPVSDLACHDYVSPADFLYFAPGVPSDTNGHGTLVTQGIAECSNNGLYGVGIAPGASIMPIRVTDSSGTTSTYEVFHGLRWALQHGADVVNLSLGFGCTQSWAAGCRDAAIDAAIADLVGSGAVVVAASGNDGSGWLSYPANHPSVIAVGASGYDGSVAAYSTRGSGLHLVAPTGDGNDPPGKDGVIHQGADGRLEVGQGTSFSAPQVSAAYAVLFSAGASPGQATQAIIDGAKDVAPTGYDVYTGHGELRIREAIAWGGMGLTPPIADAGFHAVGDATGDDRDDVVTYDRRFGRWWALTSDGVRFDAAQWARYSTVSGWQQHSSGDFTGDGRLDLASFHPSNGTWWVSPSTGASFATRLWADFSTATGWGPQLVGDFDGDGRDDIANFHSSNGTWWVSRSTGTGFVTRLWADFSTASGWKTHIVGDFNGDGRDDIASFHPSNGTWWVSTSNGSTFSTRLWADFSTAAGWTSHLAGDFDGDGRSDIANFHPANGTWWISRSTGGGFVTGLWADFTTASGWGPQLVGDYDGDGRDDIANYARSNGTWWVSRSSGSAFSTRLWADYSTATGYTTQLAGDFNGDGRDDIANHHESGVWIVSRSGGAGLSTTNTWHD